VGRHDRVRARAYPGCLMIITHMGLSPTFEVSRGGIHDKPHDLVFTLA
jgi:hypothetical protein